MLGMYSDLITFPTHFKTKKLNSKSNFCAIKHYAKLEFKRYAKYKKRSNDIYFSILKLFLNQAEKQEQLVSNQSCLAE